MTNYISLVLSAVTFVLMILRNVFLSGFDQTVFFLLAAASVLFLSPIFLNRIGYIVVSKLVVCLLPSIFLYYTMVIAFSGNSVYGVSDYVSIRFFMVAFSCFPFLIFGLHEKTPLSIAVIGGFLMVALFDPILYLFDVSYWHRALQDQNYGFANVRATVAFLVITSCCFFLKRLVEKNEALNEELLRQLEVKNSLIKEQAEAEVHQLNQQLMQNLSELSAREFILKESQRIAKIGSWEYKIKGASLFWSEEMYNIFAIDTEFELSIGNFSQLFGDEQSLILIDATDDLLKFGKSYDITLHIRTPIGYYKWLRINAFPFYEDGKIAGAKGICHDITVFRESEELIRNNDNKYRSLFEQASDAIMIFDFNSNFLDTSASLCQMVGYTKEELMQLKVTDLMHPHQLLSDPIPYDKLKLGNQVFSQRKFFHKNGTAIDVETNIKMFSEGKLMAISRDITQRKVVEREKEKANYQLNKRIKELTVLYQASRILNDNERSTDEILQELVNILPEGWQYPEITAARICLNKTEFSTPAYRDSQYKQTSEIITDYGTIGFVEVLYLEERPAETEGPFFQEERNLINMIAEMLRVFLVRKHEEEELSKAQANLSATINNTEIFIWSVDRNFKLLTFNKPFFNGIQQYFKKDIKLGTRMLESIATEEAKELTLRWEHHYLRALTGEISAVEEHAFGKEVHFSLSPIIENHKIIGVSVFGDDVTERKAKERELNEAYTKIGELKLMALRSVMSPHFIFNVLNSIQFFIVKNDRINAINYLSSFSKLIRSILSHSVSNKIKLSEELEMLRNYVQLEMARFENKFEFILDVDPDLEIDSIEIPSLLIQPYVENAILHGLYNKQGTGTLTVRVNEEYDNVIFEIEDDGVGREEALKIRKRNFPTHKSMGVKLTEERLRLINQDNDAALEIEDLHDGNVATGTRVRIKIKA
jgi:PAS domain S-box-containing protein